MVHHLVDHNKAVVAVEADLAVPVAMYLNVNHQPSSVATARSYKDISSTVATTSRLTPS